VSIVTFGLGSAPSTGGWGWWDTGEGPIPPGEQDLYRPTIGSALVIRPGMSASIATMDVDADAVTPALSVVSSAIRAVARLGGKLVVAAKSIRSGVSSKTSRASVDGEGPARPGLSVGVVDVDVDVDDPVGADVDDAKTLRPKIRGDS
jgi:hypothetical protein